MYPQRKYTELEQPQTFSRSAHILKSLALLEMEVILHFLAPFPGQFRLLMMRVMRPLSAAASAAASVPTCFILSNLEADIERC